MNYEQQLRGRVPHPSENRYIAFAIQVLELATNFDCEEIANLIDRYLPQERE